VIRRRTRFTIHAATALLAKIPTLDTFDIGLMKLAGQLGSPPMRIGVPHEPEQLTLVDAEPSDGD